ncbi:hypothetical protein HYU21_04365 [Candidatus Woesearchaeota archaeon]|nr:hypothetical protein [Candidatus Woesearchaeota archaeon]
MTNYSNKKSTASLRDLVEEVVLQETFLSLLQEKSSVPREYLSDIIRNSDIQKKYVKNVILHKKSTYTLNEGFSKEDLLEEINNVYTFMLQLKIDPTKHIPFRKRKSKKSTHWVSLSYLKRETIIPEKHINLIIRSPDIQEKYIGEIAYQGKHTYLLLQEEFDKDFFVRAINDVYTSMLESREETGAARIIDETLEFKINGSKTSVSSSQDPSNNSGGSSLEDVDLYDINLSYISDDD